MSPSARSAANVSATLAGAPPSKSPPCTLAAQLPSRWALAIAALVVAGATPSTAPFTEILSDAVESNRAATIDLSAQVGVLAPGSECAENPLNCGFTVELRGLEPHTGPP